MVQNKLGLAYGVIIVVFTLLVSILFFENPGTNDVGIWLSWVANVTQYSLVEGYALNGADYPPFSSLILFWVGHIANSLHVDLFLAIKYSLLVTLCATSIVFYFWTRQLLLTIMFHFALLLSSVGLGYLDIYFVPWLIFAFWALQKNRWLLFTLSLSIAILIKWQALIFLPFVCLYFLQIDRPTQWRSIPLRRIVWQVFIPAVTLAVLALVWFGPEVINAFLRATTGHHYLSANALNMNWIITYILHTFLPTLYGVDMKIIQLPQTAVLYTVIKNVFIIAYTLVFLKFCLEKKTYENLLVYSVLGSSAYFMMNTGTHENHLFIAVILASFLAAIQTHYRPLFIIAALSMNINLAIFYFGTLFVTDKIGPLPMTVAFALLNSVIFLLFYYFVMSQDFIKTVKKLWQQ